MPIPRIAAGYREDLYGMRNAKIAKTAESAKKTKPTFCFGSLSSYALFAISAFFASTHFEMARNGAPWRILAHADQNRRNEPTAQAPAPFSPLRGEGGGGV
jgi:hypothetical protein